MSVFNRYFAILHPLRAKYLCTKTRARRVIYAIWLTSCALATPIIFGQVMFYSMNMYLKDFDGSHEISFCSDLPNPIKSTFMSDDLRASTILKHQK